jgi:bifunctional non-homologous end joining protein LigD
VQRHVRPELVITVRYTGWTDTGMLRAPVFSGLRADKSPRECNAAPPARVEEEAEAPPSAPAAVFRGKVQVSNAGKVFWPEEGFTKGDVCNYYARVAPALLPLLAERPVVLVRYPDGIRGKSFFQWNPPRGLPSWLPTLELTDEEGKTRHGFLIRDVDALVYLANLGAIPLHVLAWRRRDPGACDFVTIDFDIGPRLLHDAIVVALSLGELLDEIGLVGYPKTSGQRGLHVLIPVGPDVSFDAAKLLVELLGRLLVARHPELATLERRVDKRGPRIYVDTGQTGQSRTIVAPYSVRAYPGATVSTPLRWDEVHGALDPRRFDIRSVPERLARGVEPMADMLELRPDIGSAVSKLERLVR